MTTLIVGFDSAWTPHNEGAIVGVIKGNDGRYSALGPPVTANFARAEELISAWQKTQLTDLTLVMLDQPTIVRNATGQRPVENLVASPVSLRYGGVQPANTTRKGMFDDTAPVWNFLDKFGGAANPLTLKDCGVHVFETYPVLAMIALDWVLADSRATGRLPKYNPARKKTFDKADWMHVCRRVLDYLTNHSLPEICDWVDNAISLDSPRKADQDNLDACLCLLVGIHLAENRECLMVGNLTSGYIVTPDGVTLHNELNARCFATGRQPNEWVRSFRLGTQ